MAAEVLMPNPLKLSSLKGIALVSSVILFVVLGVGTTLKLTVDYLLYWDATAAAESWARYVAENVIDIEEIANGKQPSAASMAFFIRTQQIRYVFGFEILDLHGNVQLASDGSKITNVGGAAHSATAARAADLGHAIVSVKEGVPPVRPKHFAEAYLPVISNQRPRAVVAAYVDLSEQHDKFQSAFLGAAFALCLLGGAGAGLPTLAWQRTTREKRRADKRIHYLAHHDGLTGLANRTQFLEELETALDALQTGAAGFAIHFIDLDYFKSVNDTLGHDGGDFLLKMIAQRLRAVSRLGDVVTRFGGDEFVVLQAGTHERAEAERFAHRMASAIGEPMQFGDNEINATVSIGFALAPSDAKSADPLLKCADLAVYRAKADGRACVRGYLPDMDARLKARTTLEKAIRNAAGHDGFVLHYQPIYGVSHRHLMGFEALIRLPASDGTLIMPDAFIPIAEELRLIDGIGAWVLREACRVAADWPSHLTVAVNASVAQFEAGALSGHVATALRESGLAPHRLELEITESMLLRNTAPIMAELHAIKGLGVAIVMDDFGTGCSSLSYLWRFPFDKIKIDQSFMAGLDSSGRTAETVAKTIISLGHDLNMRVTVEGVETDEQVAFLDEVRGDQAQGFYFGRPVPASEIATSILADFQGGGARPKPGVSGETEQSSDDAAA
jgi:diguanylate cyclase (GGDEF)-like protein